MNNFKKNNLGSLFVSKPLKGQHALITGGSRGIGAAISNALAALGADISLLARDIKTLKNQSGHIESEFGVNVFIASTDITNEKAIESSFKKSVNITIF